MTLNEIAIIRLVRQHVVNSPFNHIKDLVQSMGAMQAQDYQMAKWGVGLRVTGASDESVEAAVDSGDLIRTHLMRPTWHLVSGEDAAWLIDLTAPGIKASQKSRNRELELSDNVFARTNKILAEAVSNGNHMTREELMTVLRNEGIETANNRGYHILFMAELDRVICSGKMKNGRQTYALFSERVPSNNISRDEALRNIAGKYFFTRGPATIKDFSWWSGLSVTEARKGLEMIRTNLVSETIEGKVYWFPPDSMISYHGEKKIYLLPAYDEFIISYSDRSAALSLANRKRTVSINGIFNPVIVADGQVTGLWKRSKKNDRIIIKTELFQKTVKSVRRSIEEKAGEYGRFLKKEVEIIHHVI